MPNIPFAELFTPCLILDELKLNKNIDVMATHLADKNIRFRPHVKTAKNVDIINLALKGQFGGITVSTLCEAEYFFNHGISDILYAVGMAPSKTKQMLELRERGAELKIVLDHQDTATLISKQLGHVSAKIPVLIEIDCDGQRAGIRPDDDDLLRLGDVIDSSASLRFAGLMTHAGGSYSATNAAQIEAAAETEKRAVLIGATRLQDRGLGSDILSVGSTPTALAGKNFDGLSEVRAGVYMFYDLVMAGLGVCALEDIALSVLTTVIGHSRRNRALVCDAGWMALSRDRGTAAQSLDQAYGVVVDEHGQLLSPELLVTTVNQEHGLITRRDGKEIHFAQFPIGSRLRILPNHACATVAQHQNYAVTRDNERIEQLWSRFNGWGL